MIPDGYQQQLLEVDAAAYHADLCDHPSLSASLAWCLVTESPRHMLLRHPRLGPGHRRAGTDSMDDGTHMHAVLLGKGAERIVVVNSATKKAKKKGEPDEVIVPTDFRTDDAKQQKAEAERAGKIAVLVGDVERIESAAARIRFQMESLGIVLGEQREICALWVEFSDDGTPVQCRALIDALTLGENWAAIHDLKTTESANERHIRSYNETLGGCMQAAANIRAIERIFPETAGRVTFTQVFAEMIAPHDVVPNEVSGMMLALGDDLFRRAVNTYAACLASGKWPGRGPMRVEPSKWFQEFATAGDPDNE